MNRFINGYSAYVLVVCLACAMGNRAGWSLFSGSGPGFFGGSRSGGAYIPHGTFHK